MPRVQSRPEPYAHGTLQSGPQTSVDERTLHAGQFQCEALAQPVPCRRHTKYIAKDLAMSIQLANHFDAIDHNHIPWVMYSSITRSTVRPRPGQSSADLQYATARLYFLLRVRLCAAICNKKNLSEIVSLTNKAATYSAYHPSNRFSVVLVAGSI